MSKSSPARAQRRAAAKQTTKGMVPVQVGPRQPHDEPFLRQVQAMIKGELEPPNEVVLYQLGQLKESQAEFEAMQRNITQAEQQIAQMKVEFQRVDGRIDAHLRDIRVWMSRPGPGQTAAPEAAAPDDAPGAVPAPPPAAPARHPVEHHAPQAVAN